LWAEGTGKSHFTEALGQAAIDAGMTVAWFTIEDLGGLVRRHRVDDSVSKAFARLTRTDLVIVDDIGLLPVSADAAEGFYRLVDAAYERKSLAVSSNLHPSKAHMFVRRCARRHRDVTGSVAGGKAFLCWIGLPVASVHDRSVRHRRASNRFARRARRFHPGDLARLRVQR
jgi:hypothetical protein